MANPLRDNLAAKYGGTGASSAPVSGGQSGNTLRAALAQKYTPAYSPVTEDGMALDPTKVPRTTTQNQNISLRDKVSQKYSTPSPTSRVGKEQAAAAEKKKKEDEAKYGVIASPEHFATSVDVRSESGKFLKTFKGTQPGEAKAAAEKYALEKGGFIEVTPPAGILGRMFVRAKEAFTSALDSYTQKTGEFTQALGGMKKDPAGGPALVDDPDATPLRRAAKTVEAGVSAAELVLSPVAAFFTAGEEIPVAGKAFEGFNYIFGKIGEGGDWAAGKAVDSLPVSDKTKAEIKPAATELASLLAQLAAGKAGEVAVRRTATLREEIKTKITKDVIETNQLPRNVYITPEAVRSIFIDSSKISPEEAAMIKDLGLDGKGYRDAIKNGVSIEIPSEKIITIADKPWFAKVKGIFGIEPTSVRIVDAAGKPVKNTLIPEERRLESGDGANAKPGAVLPVEMAVDEVFVNPITPSLLERVNSLTPEESTAFGKKIVESINESLGLKIDAEKAKLPENIKVVEQKSADGRPAQFRNGEIEVFLPNMLEDIKTLTEGGTITAHEGEFATVYKMKEGESIEDLSTRYVRDVIIHEVGHQRTMTMEDATKIQQLQSGINQAKLAQNQQGIIDAREALTSFMKTLEDKANAYIRENRAALEQEFFGGPKRETQTEMQRRISQTTNRRIPTRTPAKLTQKQALLQKIRARRTGAKEGFNAGKKEGKATEAEKRRSMHQNAIDKIKARQATIADRKKAAIDYAQILPFRERGKFLKAINNLRSEKEFLDVIDRISKSSKAAERKVLITEIAKELKGTIVKKKDGIPNAKFALEAQRTLNEMRRLQKTMTYQ